MMVKQKDQQTDSLFANILSSPQFLINNKMCKKKLTRETKLALLALKFFKEIIMNFLLGGQEKTVPRIFQLGLFFCKYFLSWFLNLACVCLKKT